MAILDKIVQLPFSEDQYLKVQHEKTQIIGHHTVSGGSAKAVANYWGGNKPRVATCMIIDKAGVPHQLFSSKYWGGHVGGKSSMGKEFSRFGIPYRNCSKASIGVELVSWGGLNMIDGQLYNAYGDKFNEESIFYERGYRGYFYFDKYTQEQIDTYGELLKYWGKRYNIPLTYSEDIWDVSPRALNGQKGVFTHTSFRSDKSDLHPQEELITMLKSLT